MKGIIKVNQHVTVMMNFGWCR